MQLIFAARRGRRVFQQLNLQQTAPLSTRVPIAVSQVRHVFRLPTSLSVSLVKSRNSTVEQLATLQRHHYTTSAAPATQEQPSKDSKDKVKKSKAASKKKSKKPLSPEQLEKKRLASEKERLASEKKREKKRERNRAKLQDEKFQAKKSQYIADSLKNEEPKFARPVPWTMFLVEGLKGHGGRVEPGKFSDLSIRFRNLSSSEREALEQKAEKLKEENATKYISWLHQYTPLQIKQANEARKQLPKLLQAHGKRPIKLRPLEDERLVKRPMGSFIQFYADKAASGEYKGQSAKDTTERAKLEFLNLPEQQKQIWDNKAKEDLERYAREYREVYGEEPRFLRPKESKSRAKKEA